MPKYEVEFDRTVRRVLAVPQYATITVEAEDAEDAKLSADAIMDERGWESCDWYDSEEGRWEQCDEETVEGPEIVDAHEIRVLGAEDD